MNGDEMGRVLDKLNAGWPDRRSMPDNTLAMWHEELVGLDFSPAFAAARALAREAQYFPKPTEFIKAYYVHKSRQTDVADDTPPCVHCDHGWITVVDLRPSTVRPCEHCSRQQYDVWRRGGFKPRGGHADALGRAS